MINNDIVKEFYNNNFKKYIKLRNHYWSEARRFFNFIDKYVEENNIIEPTFLDLGCGHGKYFYLTKSYKSYGIDISDNLISYAKSTHPNVNLVIGNIIDLPYLSNTFNFIISVSTIHHLSDSDQELMIKEMIRVLKPYGHAFVSGVFNINYETKIIDNSILIPTPPENKYIIEEKIFNSQKNYYNLINLERLNQLFSPYVDKNIVEIISTKQMENSNIIIIKKK